MTLCVQTLCQHEIDHVKLRFTLCGLSVINNSHIYYPGFIPAHTREEIYRRKIRVAAACVQKPVELFGRGSVFPSAYQVERTDKLKARRLIVGKCRLQQVAEHSAMGAPRAFIAFGYFFAFKQQLRVFIPYVSPLFVHYKHLAFLWTELYDKAQFV